MLIKRITTDRKKYKDLLLLADPSEEMIDRYLEGEGSDMFVLFDSGRIVGEAVVDITGEIKNVAVALEMQGHGWGKRLLDYLCGYYRGCFDELYVGTSEAGVAFYEKCGFRYSHTLKDFFIINYPEPVLENGVQCVDMIYLKRNLTGK